jgi:hypothetical protein
MLVSKKEYMICSIRPKLKTWKFVLHVVWLPHMKNMRIIVTDHLVFVVFIETVEISMRSDLRGNLYEIACHVDI